MEVVGAVQSATSSSFSASRHSDANTFYIKSGEPESGRGHRHGTNCLLIALIQKRTVFNKSGYSPVGVRATSLTSVLLPLRLKCKFIFSVVSPRLTRGNNILPVQKHRRQKCPIRSRAEREITPLRFSTLLFIGQCCSEWHL